MSRVVETLEGMMQKQAQALRPGDLIDLEGDQYADPNKDHPDYEFTLQRVLEVERETIDCVRVDTEAASIGFPVAHLIECEACAALQTAVPQDPTETQLELAASLACYTSGDDRFLDRKEFLINVRDRIDLDLQTGEY